MGKEGRRGGGREEANKGVKKSSHRVGVLEASSTPGLLIYKNQYISFWLKLFSVGFLPLLSEST